MASEQVLEKRFDGLLGKVCDVFVTKSVGLVRWLGNLSVRTLYLCLQSREINFW